LVNAEAAPFVQAKLNRLPGVRYIIDMPKKSDDAEAIGVLLGFFIRCLLAGTPGRASNRCLNESFA
jgi:hypothetical protein